MLRLFQLPGKKVLSPSGWNIQAKLDMYIWFGLAKNKRDYLKGLPDGYDMTRATNSINSPPMYLTYRGKIFIQRSIVIKTMDVLISQW